MSDAMTREEPTGESAVGEEVTAPELTIPALALVVIASGDIATAREFAARHFTPAEIALVAPEVASPEAFLAARGVLDRRLAEGELAVALPLGDDPALIATLIRDAHSRDVSAVAIALGGAVPLARFPVGPRGFAAAHALASLEAWTAARVTRRPLACDLRGERGPFDIIGDVHGCYDELLDLLAALGYTRDEGAAGGWRHPDGRRVIFVGDLVDRGPGVVAVARLAMALVAAGQGFCAPGNHDVKLARALEGRNVFVAHGLRESLDQIAALPAEERAAFTRDFVAFVRALPPYLWLAEGDLIVAHAGLPERYHGRVSERIRALALYGETTGWEDEYGHPQRIDWAADYGGAAAVVYGHTPWRETHWRHNTINVDTGCVHGGRLTAVRWPERDLVSVPARRVYAPRAGGLR
ncbi:MAG TPA: metallophosphoesterase [Ktedonobacterales bacterium]